MVERRTSVYGIFPTADAADRAAAALVQHGFPDRDISAVIREPGMPGLSVAEERAANATAVGAATGAAVGGTVGLLAAIGWLAIPGVGPFLALGPIVSSLGGLTAGTAVGGFFGSLVGVGVPEESARRYDQHVTEGRVLLGVHTADDDAAGLAKDVLERSGAVDLTSAPESVGTARGVRGAGA